VSKTITPTQEQSNSLDQNLYFNVSEEENFGPKKMEVIDSQPNLNETPNETSTSIDLWDLQIEKSESKHNLYETETLQQHNLTPIPESRESTAVNLSNTSLLQASPVPIITSAISSSPCLFMTPSPLSFGEENLFKMEFKNSVLDFLLPSPVLSSPSENPFKQIEAPLPMEEDLTSDEL